MVPRDARAGAATDALTVIRATAGSALLLAPARIVGSLPGHRCDRATLVAARAIGARNLIEAGLLRRRSARRWILVGIAIDAVHATTMVALAFVRPADRAPALSSALAAVTMVGAGVATVVAEGHED